MKNGIDMLSVSVLIATIVDWLPAAAALFTIVWTLLRIIESLDDLGWIDVRKKKKPPS